MLLFLIFIFGLITGSFLNVVIYRLKSGRNVFFGRSFCPGCKIIIKWYDLIPVFSFFWLKKQCRYCGKKISWQYPIVEILSGLIWVLVFNKNLDNFEFLISNFQLLNVFYEIFILSALLVIAVYDYKWQIIPDKIVFPAIIVIFLYNILDSLRVQNIETFIWQFLIAITAFSFFFSLYFFSSGRAMGFGDAKLAFLIGLFLSPILSTVAFVLAFTFGAVFGIILLAFTDKTLRSQIAFGPFLVIGTVISFFFSNFLLRFFS